MSKTDPKALAERYYHGVITGGDLADLDRLAVEDFVEHDPFPGQGTGLEGLKDRVRMLRAGVGPSFSLEDVISDGARLVVRWKSSGTHVADFLGVPPTNKSYTIDGIDIFALRDGKLAEHWHVVDQLSMLQQIGIIPMPEGADA
jgi:steroid delta-isomerase-like uncharacterized protein